MKLVNPFAHSKKPAPKTTTKSKAQVSAIEKNYKQQFRDHINDDCVIVDTETTGILGKCDNPRIIEISIINMQGEALLSCLLNPECQIPAEATAVNGITDVMVAGAPTFKATARSILNELRGKTIIGWNIQFDINMIKHELNLACMTIPTFETWDAMGPYAQATGKGRYYKLCLAASDIGVEEEQNHRSLGDCRMTLEVMKRFVAKE